ncbi:MAG: T9SS type A sorting domain-containing protein [Paludibacter sp.]|nr:T9SS type A sorting domain-containing protein [Paludibacter sp.]
MNKLISRIVFLQIILILSLQSAFSNSNKHLVTQLQIVDNDTTFRISYFYENNSVKSLETKSFQKNNQWINLSQTEWYYRDSVLYKQVERKWTNNIWVDVYQIDRDIENNITTVISSRISNNQKIYEKKNVTTIIDSANTVVQGYYYNNQWTLDSYQSDTYTNGHIKQTEISPDKSESDSLKYRYIYDYNNGNTISSLTILKSINGNEFCNLRKSSYFYDSQTSLLSSIRIKSWDTLQSSWKNFEKTEYTYNTENHVESEIFYRWGIQAWISILRNQYNYNNDVLSNKLTQLPIYREWRNTVHINYGEINSENSQTIESVFDFWGGDKDELATSFIPFDFNGKTIIQKGEQLKLTYTFYDNVTDPKFSNLRNDIIDIYPNPTDGICYFNTETYEVSAWTLTDLKGKVMLQKKENISSGVVDLTGLNRGIYILMAQTADGVLKQKIIKQ